MKKPDWRTSSGLEFKEYYKRHAKCEPEHCWKEYCVRGQHGTECEHRTKEEQEEVNRALHDIHIDSMQFMEELDAYLEWREEMEAKYGKGLRFIRREYMEEM